MIRKIQWVIRISFLICITLYMVLGLPNIHSSNRLLIIPRGCTRYQLKAQLKNEGYIKNGTTFLWATCLLKYDPKHRPGQYLLTGNMNNWQLVRMLRGGIQHPVKLTFSTAAHKEALIDQLVSHIGINKAALWALLHDAKTLASYGFTPENVLTMFIPDTYEVYWTITPAQLLSKMHLAYKRFWNTTRLNQAKKIGLSPIQVSILASIVQAETNNQQEAAMIAGVYLNRLKRKMPLQSCPTLIYALKEDQSGARLLSKPICDQQFLGEAQPSTGEYSSVFEERRPQNCHLAIEFRKRSIKRVLQQDTNIDSPYNSYRKKGLPPGPIGLPTTAMIEAVLNYIPHDYLFFSAKEDFSGLHYFARNYKEHVKNANKYRKALNGLKVMR
ncbi:MAG: endolytic transglycosylase MltG [Candidatus Cardinium sp.]|uniref:endolytic transglycosylase MltG n=1 Tax=Cardinium endosymbiont of Dermatophagoides farinae TaxID=2597823 RepID=UPI001183B852|nr:endolytic transglycosylase MltG [Cardinium endosymbiont of Dermatophagoides farinae]TSJ81232.1 endolytic transglycosylase MltG [Cardinium endosymbiont of Dermatophagoides farinae]UWW97283.1 MAG: endolytic transglycosylase MltG [Candidatus Cardinium sp.]